MFVNGAFMQCLAVLLHLSEVKEKSESSLRPSTSTVFPRFSAPGRLPIFEVFGGALNRAGALIKTYENLDLPFPAHTRTLFIIYDLNSKYEFYMITIPY